MSVLYNCVLVPLMRGNGAVEAGLKATAVLPACHAVSVLVPLSLLVPLIPLSLLAPLMGPLMPGLKATAGSSDRRDRRGMTRTAGRTAGGPQCENV